MLSGLGIILAAIDNSFSFFYLLSVNLCWVLTDNRDKADRVTIVMGWMLYSLRPCVFCTMKHTADYHIDIASA